MLTRLDTWPVYGMVCGPLTIIGNVTDEAQTGVDPTGVAKIWATLNGTEVADFTPRAECPVSVEFILNLDLDASGSLKLHAEDCEGNEIIFRNTNVDVFDEDPPFITWVFPIDGATITGSSWMFEVDIDSDNEDLEVCLDIDGLEEGCDTSAPYKWLVGNLEDGPHITTVTATDGCGCQSEVEINFEVQENGGSDLSP